MRNRWLVLVGAVAATLVIAACGSSSSSTGGSTSGSALSTKHVGSATLLTNAKGFTLYWFVPDTSTTSHCNGSCAHFWPPVPGPVTAGSGVHGTLGTITRSSGATQATWNGHPLYTYIGDTAPGMAKGNGLKLSGGIWHDIVMSGTSSASSGGGGYGY
jgi:predicted lipoprotein with Yx(FWY)xxD motif